MNINLKATNLELTPAIRAYVEKKLEAAEKYLGQQKVVNCDVEVELITHHHHKGEIFRAEINLQLPHDLLRVERTADDLYKAVDELKDHLAELIKRHKEKRLAKRRNTQQTDS